MGKEKSHETELTTHAAAALYLGISFFFLFCPAVQRKKNKYSTDWREKHIASPLKHKELIQTNKKHLQIQPTTW